MPDLRHSDNMFVYIFLEFTLLLLTEDAEIRNPIEGSANVRRGSWTQNILNLRMNNIFEPYAKTGQIQLYVRTVG